MSLVQQNEPVRAERLSQLRSEESTEGCNIAGFEDGGEGYEPRNEAGLQELGKARNRFSSP